MVTTRKATPETIRPMQLEYFQGFVAPLDAYWQEGLIGAAEPWEILIDGQRAGYFVSNAEHQLLQFHLGGPSQSLPDLPQQASKIFRRVLELHGVQSAFAATIEPFYFGLCLDHQTRAEVHTLLFTDHRRHTPTHRDYEASNFRPATADDVKRVVPLFAGGDEFVDDATVQANFGGFLEYAESVIEGKILHVLEKDGEIIGTGELRERKDWPPHADVGMIVSPRHRRCGVGTYILSLLKAEAYARDLVPICSCEAANVGSRKAVENAGFSALHRVVHFTF